MPLEVRRIYGLERQAEHAAQKEGSLRIFVDGLWARGIKKEEAGIDLWLKDIAPSTKLRKWFGHDPWKWDEFKQRYFKELDENKELVELILQKLRSDTSILLLYGAKDDKFNNAVALEEYLLKQLAK